LHEKLGIVGLAANRACLLSPKLEELISQPENNPIQPMTVTTTTGYSFRLILAIE
jgi:hypothetical protein